MTTIGNLHSSAANLFKRIFTENISPFGAKSFFFLTLRIFLLLFIYMVLERLILSAAQLSEDQYTHRFIFPEILKNILGKPLVIFLPFLGVLIWKKTIWNSWSSMESGNLIRGIIILVAFILGWSFSTYDINLYYNHTHLLDRILLLILLAGIFWRPIFVLPFTLLVVSLIYQFTYPFGPYSVAQQYLLVRILILFLGMFVLYSLTGRQKIDDFIFITLTLVASSYWWPGFGKIQLGWINIGHLYQLLFATYAKGWLAFLEPTTVETMGKIYSWFDWPIRIGTFVLEVGALLALWRRNLFIVFLGGWILFHIGIFMMTGICFWNWIILDAVLLGLFLKNHHFKSLPIFSKQYFLISILLIGGCKFWFKPVNLAWYDTRIGYSSRFEVVGESGRHYSLSPQFFSPYDYQFTVGGTLFLVKEKRLPIAWGVTKDLSVAKALLKANTEKDIFELESELGTIWFMPKMAEKYDHFLKRIFSNLNARGTKKTWLSFIHAPPQLWTFPRGNSYEFQEGIVKLRIYEITSLFDGKHYLEIRNQLLYETNIP